jgi:hypothetical protein
MLTCEELNFLIQKRYPNLVRGKDYFVAHPVNERTLEQIGPAWIVTWYSKDHPLPITDEIAVLLEQYGDELRIFTADQAARLERANLLTVADQLVEKAIDSGSADAEAKARAYRQALRDVTTQEGFPLTITWPVSPAA